MTEAETSVKLALIRQACRDFYRPPEPKKYSVDSADGLTESMLRLKHLIIQDLMMAAPPIPMSKIDDPSIKIDEFRYMYEDEFLPRSPSKFETRGAGKNPFAEPHISKPPRKG